MSRGGRAVGLIAALCVLAGCASVGNGQSALNPRGPRAEEIFGLYQFMLVTGVIVWVIVVAATVIAAVRRRRRAEDQGANADDAAERPDEHDDVGQRRRPLWIVATAGAIVPAVIISILTVMSAVVLRDLDIDPEDEGGTVIQVIGHQFWWEVSYPEHGIITANEIHIPSGERLQLEVTANDVIHSFWVPELSGKIDMIPGRSNSIWLEASEPGIFWGQCAEFCGTQHALMRFVVVAHEPDEFAGWVRSQQRPAAGEMPDSDESIARGREVFLSSSCVYCHTVAGSAATGEVGPDLTHLASRSTIGAGVLANDRESLRRWVLDPQSVKPGNLMPATEIDGDELEALLDYLESLD